MAKSSPKEGIYVEKPKSDVYVAIIILSTIALIAACAIMALELNGIQ